MAQYFNIHPETPQARLISQAADIIRQGGLAVYPTDSCYALGCHLGEKEAVDRIRQIRQLDKHHNMTLLCRDLSEIATYAKVSNPAYRLMKSLTPGPYTFLLRATKDVPRRLQHAKRKTIGLRVPENHIAQALLEALGEPMLSTSLILPQQELPLSEVDEIKDRLNEQVDAIIDGGGCGIEATTVIDLLGEEPVLLRQGKGDIRL
ncbi:MAG TPA: threonylcarbamoyl-AMP synthase [Thiotrichaceae bacterium]|jgi:tRNA threonylcarbamoyl adenosine modification protein (Sua5/YciO/YrdC/YwlC family)|nr:threonylcarbamoyl-AMP synthase [Thiotrichaceae bacterium]HIM07803.1 threonylcarbamoyl-AMP synthase [Gammaproteobacteria bacterium]